MRPKRQGSDRGNSTSNSPVPTTAENFPDGTMLGLGPRKWGVQVVFWRNKRPTLSRRVQVGDRNYEPAVLDPSVLDAIRFPGGIANYGSTNRLFQSIIDAASKYTGLPSIELRVSPDWVLGSWFPEILAAQPTLVVAAPSPADAHRFFGLVRCFCRRGVLTTELTPGGFLNLPMHLQPTLLIEQSRMVRQMRGLLRAASTRGAYVSVDGGFLDLGCPKAVFCERRTRLTSSCAKGCLRFRCSPQRHRLPFSIRMKRKNSQQSFNRGCCSIAARTSGR